MKLSIVMPAYNEEKNIGKTIDSVLEKGYNDIIVVDDGSKDKTYEIAKSKGVIVLKHIVNCGQGAALQTGTDYAILRKSDIIVHFDSDGQHSAGEIKKIISPILEGKVSATLGSRFLNNNCKIPLNRKIILKGGILFHKVFYGLSLSDAHNGFRALSLEAAKKIKIQTDGMEHNSEIVHKIKQNRIKYKEVPVTIKYTKETLEKGQSNLNSIKIVFKLLIRKLNN